MICQKSEDAVPLQRIYLSQTLFELVLVRAYYSNLKQVMKKRC
ncbi:hypothetical protein FDUTEX481_07749 [Tolypothrix sp. PCC 7601]|nr:hypothetical protein FDUTEX481_07749 [Tolypothrix sp. PCC 7601]